MESGPCVDHSPACFRALVIHIFKYLEDDIADFPRDLVCVQVPMQVVSVK